MCVRLMRVIEVGNDVENEKFFIVVRKVNFYQ